MKIVVWNCRMAFARKCQPLYDLHPDIAVIPECSKNDLQPGLFDHFDARWFGDNPRKGLGVLVAKPLRIIRAEKPPNRWVVPLSISGGASDFRLIAVWAMPVKGSVVKSYIGQVYEAIANHPQWFPSKPSRRATRSDAFVEAGVQSGSSLVAQALLPVRSSPAILENVGAGPNFSRERQSPIGVSSPRFVPARLDGVYPVNAYSAPSHGVGGINRLIGGSSFPDFRSSNFDFPKPPSSPSSTPAAPKPVILCGDFNSNKIWDDHRKTHNHSAVVSLLEKRGLLSAYHHFFSEPQGHETRPTYYFWHRQNRGYHIDYVFLPRAWAPCIQSVAVGHHADWSHLSDHVPVSVDLAIPAS